MEKHYRHVFLFLLVAALVLFAVSCGETGKEEPQTQMQSSESAGKANEDVQHAKALWTEIKNYSTWTVPEGFSGWQEGKSPHGAVLRYFVNDIAAGGLTKDGAVIIKENYSEESEDALKSVTVMEKRQGYDPETQNWFYVKYSPDGKVMKNPQGVELAGLVGKGKGQGCVPCHAAAGGDDYLFMND